jgi:anti-sigma factor RsiW
MDHEVVVREGMTEKYLLNELDSAQRDEFEEHYFDCPECALDVRAGSAFVERAKRALQEVRVSEPIAVPRYQHLPQRERPVWRRLLFPVPVLALLLAVVGYQNLVTFPALRRAQDRPQILPWASVNVGTWGAGGPLISIAAEQSFLLFVRIPPGGDYQRYEADLQGPSGKVEWSLAIPAESARDQWPIQVPGTGRETGDHLLIVRGISLTGESKEVGRASFVLQIHK